PLFDCAMCITRWAKEFISGVGLKLNFSAGMASAAATMFFEKRGSCAFTAALTGFATGPSLVASCVFEGVACCAQTLAASETTAIIMIKRISPCCFRIISVLLEFRFRLRVRKHTLRAFTQQDRNLRPDGTGDGN